MSFKVRGVPQSVADEVRRTRVSPGYGHPVHEEVATGSGPCRCCLRPFEPGRERRLLFTYRPAGDDSSLMAPGPVFIHADHCDAFGGEGFPPELRALPLAFEARGLESRVVELTIDSAAAPEAHIERLLGSDGNEWLHVRHAHAGCFIARVDR
jgi:hypothetical protein